MDKKNSKNAKGTGKSTEKKPKAKTEVKVNQKEKDFQRLEEYLNESGLSLAFNIIFAELISKQIVRENYFTYTAMRLTQIGKEIEGLKTKEIIYVDDREEEKKEGESQSFSTSNMNSLGGDSSVGPKNNNNFDYVEEIDKKI